jgi:hypothetical protein
VEILIPCALCLGGLLCTAPFTLDILGGRLLRLEVRYLGIRQNITGCLQDKIRRIGQEVLESRNLFGTLEPYIPLFRKPLALSRFRLRLAFSSGDAAETALYYGGLCLLLNSLYPLPALSRPEITLEPRFTSRREAAVDCTISLTMPAAVFLFRLLVMRFRKKNAEEIPGTKKRRPHV